MAIQITDLEDRLPPRWQAKSEAQKAALRCPAQVLLFGGAAGSLKSTTLLVDAIKYHKHPRFRGIIFRKSYPEIEFLIDRTRELYNNTSGRFYEAARQWRWPWGAVLEFRHLENDKDVYKHQGPEYQFVGFDESTHQKEFQVRYLLNSRMRSVDNIPLRMRLATNPGNVGHGYHKAIFHGPKCSHCILKTAEESGREPQWLPGSRKPGLIYKDARWPSDSVPMEHTTCFIPGRVSDHTMFGEGGGEYAKKLRGLPKALQEALLQGCWEAFEGQYFDCFDFNVHMVAPDTIGHKEWWPYWVGIDYGFAHATCAYLFTRAPDGRVFVLDEYVVHRRKAVDVATDLKKIWGEYRIKAWYLSPDAFDHDGKSQEDFSGAELMSVASNVYFDRAYNDRISGAMLIYTLLSENKLFISTNCQLLPVSLQTRVHAEKNPEDVEKIDTEDEDDAYDGFRYGVASHINPTQRPEAEVIADLAANQWSQDPTVAMLQFRQYMAKKSQETAPLFYRQRSGQPRRGR